MEQGFGRAFADQAGGAAGQLVQGGHALAVAVEGQLGQAGQAVLHVLAVQAVFGGGGEQGRLGGVAQRRPFAVRVVRG
ncbi:hypothetical protein GCM10020220_093550 [Nonomuraea rubra]